MLIFDEVKCGARSLTASGGADGSCRTGGMGQSIGGGSTIGAFGGDANIMDHVTTRAAQQERSTATPCPRRSADGPDQVLTRDAYDHLGNLGTCWPQDATEPSPSRHPAPHRGPGRQGLVSYRATPLTNYRDFLGPSPTSTGPPTVHGEPRHLHDAGDEEQWTVSVQHTETDVQTYIDAFGEFSKSSSHSASLPSSRRGERAHEQMHRYTDETEALSRAIEAYPVTGSPTRSPWTTRPRGGLTSEPAGRSSRRAWASRGAADLDRCPAPATISTDHPSSDGFVRRPHQASGLFDLVVGASSTIAAGWIDGAGAIWAENQALRWVADLVGYPPDAGGSFVSGGSAGNLSALVTARAAASERLGHRPERGWKIALAESAHSSIVTAARVMDVGIVRIDGDDRAGSPGRRWRARSTARAGRAGRRVRGGGQRRRHERRHGRRSGRHRGHLCRPKCGFMSMAHTVGPAWWLPASAISTTASNVPIRSSWIRTSGCSHPTTAAPCSTAIPPALAACSARRRATWTP